MQSPMINEAIVFPLKTKMYSWDELFALCKRYRKKKKIPLEDHVILFTEYDNEMNWFGSMEENANNYFIQTSHWNHFFGNDQDVRFPLAYEVAAWILRRNMFANTTEVHNGLHLAPVGCMNDFCEDKKQVILKMRTGDVCAPCIHQIKKKDVSPTLVNQVFSIFDNIRKYMTWKERASFLRQPSRLEIQGLLKRIYLSDAGNLEVKLNPTERALYLLFLNHQEGILLSHISDHKIQLLEYYSQFSRQDNQAAIEKSIDHLLNPLDNNMNIALSRIRSKFKDVVGDELYDYYSIEGERGEKFRIKLEREYITFS